MIYVFGANGQLGLSLKKVQQKEIKVSYLSSKDLDITSTESLTSFFNKANSGDFIINCAAYTAVDKAESEKERAFEVNAGSLKIISALCKSHGVNLIHISTDYIFDGTTNSSLDEEAMTNPINIYGESKLSGENNIKESGCSYSIFRTSWVFSEFGSNFVKSMINLSARETLNVVSDQIGSPTYAPDLAEVLYTSVQNFEKCKNQVFNFSNTGKCSWYEFSVRIMSLIEAKTQVTPIPTTEYPTPAKRPHYSLLNKSKIKSTFNIEVPYWKDGLDDCLRRLGERK